MAVVEQKQMSREIDLESYLPKLRTFFSQREEVALVYLYGSYVQGQIWAESDLDLGVLFDKSIPPWKRFRLTLRYGGELTKLVEWSIEVDLREINEAPLEFQYQVLKHGKCVYTRDEAERICFETELMMRYLDFKPVLDEFYSHMYARLKRGEFSARLPGYSTKVRALVDRARETRELSAVVEGGIQR